MLSRLFFFTSTIGEDRGYRTVQWHSSLTYLATSLSVPPYVLEGSGGVGGALVGHFQCKCDVGALSYDLGSWC